MQLAESFLTYFFGALGIALVLKNGDQVSAIIKSTADGAKAVSSALLA